MGWGRGIHGRIRLPGVTARRLLPRAPRRRIRLPGGRSGRGAVADGSVRGPFRESQWARDVVEGDLDGPPWAPRGRAVQGCRRGGLRPWPGGSASRGTGRGIGGRRPVRGHRVRGPAPVAPAPRRVEGVSPWGPPTSARANASAEHGPVRVAVISAGAVRGGAPRWLARRPQRRARSGARPQAEAAEVPARLRPVHAENPGEPRGSQSRCSRAMEGHSHANPQPNRMRPH